MNTQICNLQLHLTNIICSVSSFRNADMYHPQKSALFGCSFRMERFPQLMALYLQWVICFHIKIPSLFRFAVQSLRSFEYVIAQMWGGIVVWNPSACLMDSKLKHPLRRKISPEVSSCCALTFSNSNIFFLFLLFFTCHIFSRTRNDNHFSLL